MKNKMLTLVLVSIIILSSFVSNSEVVAQTTMETTKTKVIDESYGDLHTYKIYLPENYDTNKHYPSLYLMPKDGLTSMEYMEDGIETYLNKIMASDQAIDMIVIMPDYNEGDDFTALLQGLVDDVEAKYSVIRDASYRGILGVGVGGYMAYASALLDDTTEALFSAVGSHMGSFNNNIWTDKGSVYDAAVAITPDVMKTKYYYIDGPNEEAATTQVGSSADIGSTLMQKTNPYYGSQYVFYATPNTAFVEYSIRNGMANKEFYLESLSRSLNRFSVHFTKNLLTGQLVLKPQAVTSKDPIIKASVELNLSDVISKYNSEVPSMELSISMIEPITQTILYSKTETVSYSREEIGESVTKEFDLERLNMSSGVNTYVAVKAKILGMTFDLSNQTLVNVKDTGKADDEQLVDLMGDWYFNAYKEYKADDTETIDLDFIDNISKETYEQWDVVQPAMGWWGPGFASSLLSENSATYAWHVREFQLPSDFSKEGLLLAIGKVDEANEVFINGVKVGSTGFDYSKAEVGIYDGSNPWDVNCVYDVDESILKYGETNTIAVRICNSSGGGGWYEGPVGLYSKAAYNKGVGKPSVYAPEAIEVQVMNLVEEQINAIEKEDLVSFAETLSYDFFDSGYDKERKVAEIQGWIKDYSDIQIIDSDASVFVDDDLFDYVTQRVMTGKDATGQEQVIFEGEINQYFDVSNESVIEYGNHSRFFVDTYMTDAIDGTMQELTARVYLPEGYFNSQKRFKTSYLLHGINSSSKTFEIDKINQVLDQNIADGLYDEMIVILPDDPTKTSFWKDAYADMITVDLIPTMDQRYRTINDARFRFIAGASMGGAGSFGIGLTNPNLFSSVVSFYGALTFNDILPNTIEATPEYLSGFSIFMVSGNQDNYNFYDIAGKMSHELNEKQVDHYLYIDNGGHNSEFYLPLFDDAYAYVDKKMYAPIINKSILAGDLSAVEENTSLQVTYDLSVDKTISTYLDSIEDSPYTKEINPDIVIPMTLVIEQNNQVIYTTTQYFTAKEEQEWSGTLSIDNPDIDMTQNYTVKMYASFLDKTFLMSKQIVLSDNELSFGDIENHWAKESINYTAAKGIFSGTGKGKFSPNISMTRGMFVTVMSRLANVDNMDIEGMNPYEDVSMNAYYGKAVLWATQNNIVNGVGSNKFAPDQEISRDQMAVILYNYAKVMNIKLETVNEAKSFTDNSLIPDWASEAIQQMQEAALIEGKPGDRYDPQGKLTRAEAATVLTRFIKSTTLK